LSNGGYRFRNIGNIGNIGNVGNIGNIESEESVEYGISNALKLAL
jgi:hypothetical protein